MRIGDRLLAKTVFSGNLVVPGAGELRIVIELDLGIGLADVGIVDPFLRIELLHPSEILQHLDVGTRGIDQRRLDGRVGRHVAAGTEEDIDHFLVDAGPFLDLFGGKLWISAQPGVCGRSAPSVGDDNFRIFFRKVGAHHDAVKGRQIGLDAVKDLSRKAAERQ